MPIAFITEHANEAMGERISHRLVTSEGPQIPSRVDGSGIDILEVMFEVVQEVHRK